MKTRRFITNTACHILLAILSVIWVLPILFVVLTSFRKESGSYKTYIWPKAFTLDNYKNLITGHSNIDFTRWFFNTFMIAIFSTLISAFFVLWEWQLWCYRAAGMMYLLIVDSGGLCCLLHFEGSWFIRDRTAQAVSADTRLLWRGRTWILYGKGIL